MTSKTGKQAVAINILPNISKNKSNQTMKFIQLINVIFFFKIHAESEARRLVPDHFLFF